MYVHVYYLYMTPKQAREYQQTGKMPWNDTDRRARDLVKAARSKYGAGWAHLSDEQRRGAVALEVVAALVMQDEESASPAVLRLQALANAAMAAVAS